MVGRPKLWEVLPCAIKSAPTGLGTSGFVLLLFPQDAAGPLGTSCTCKFGRQNMDELAASWGCISDLTHY